MQIYTSDFYRQLLDEPELKRIFDFSEIPVNHPCYLSIPHDLTKFKSVSLRMRQREIRELSLLL